MTDSMYQNRPEMRLHYQQTGQPTISYPETVEKLDALEAVEKYKPHTVFAAWVTKRVTKKQPTTTHGCAGGVDWELLLSRVKRIIFVGSEDIHNQMTLLNIKHETYKFPWIISRTQRQDANFIAIWKNRKWNP